MKHYFIIIIIVILGSQFLYTQELDKKKFFSPEIMISLNRTTVADRNTHDRFGFGAGIYFPFFDKKRCNLIVGLEYNRNTLFKKYMSTNGKWGGGNYNTTYDINNIGIPVCLRVNMGKKIKFFIEAGAFFDLAVFGREKGTYKVVIINPIDSTTTKIDRTFNSKISYKMPNFGIQGGIGLRIPIQKYEILLKGDYKWGMRNLIDNYYGIIRDRYWRFSVGFKI